MRHCNYHRLSVQAPTLSTIFSRQSIRIARQVICRRGLKPYCKSENEISCTGYSLSSSCRPKGPDAVMLAAEDGHAESHFVPKLFR
jgi:hypothetical protein